MFIPVNNAPSTKQVNARTPSNTYKPLAAFATLPKLVLPPGGFFPPCPFEVARTCALIVTVFFATAVVTVVENAETESGLGEASLSASCERKTSAKPGAGTLTGQMLLSG